VSGATTCGAAVVVVAGNVVEVDVDVDGSAVVEPEAAPAPLLHAESASPPAAARTRRGRQDCART